MAGGQIHHVKVVPDTGPIRRIVVIAPDIQPFAPPDGYLGHERNEIVGDAFRIFPDQPALVGADGVEITQEADPQLRRRMQIAQLSSTLAGSRYLHFYFQRMILGRQKFRNPVHRGR